MMEKKKERKKKALLRIVIFLFVKNITIYLFLYIMRCEIVNEF